MDEKEFNQKLNEYINRVSFWTEKSINQFGYSLNLFTTVGIGFLGYLISNRNKYPALHINWNDEIDWDLVFYLFSILIITFSIILGFFAVLSRLYDFRLTRHVSLTRKRFLSHNKNKYGLFKGSIIDSTKVNSIKVIKQCVLGKIDFITEEDFKDKEILRLKMEKLRTYSKVLGNTSWILHRNQIILFIWGLLFYCLTVFI